MTYVSLDHFFMTLGNRQRVHILQMLAKYGPLSVMSISERLGAEQSSVSHSLRQLLRCHFVSVSQQGKERIYAVNASTVAPLLEHIGRHVRKYCVKGCEHWK